MIATRSSRVTSHMKSSDWATWRLFDEQRVFEIMSSGGWFVHGTQKSDRDSYLMNFLPSGAPRVEVQYLSDEEYADRIVVSINGGSDIIDDPDPVSVVQRFADRVVLSGQPVVIDITSLSIPAVFLLLQAFQAVDFDHVVAAHVEPLSYNLDLEDSLVPTYRLSDTCSAVRGIPGFFRPTHEDQVKTMYVTLGFEGHRFTSVVDYFDNDAQVRPILPLPSYGAGWHMLAIHGNLAGLNQSKTARMLRRIPAHNPFHLLSVLEDHHATSSGTGQMVVSPLGTKPHGLGMALFAVRHEDVVVVYDHPTPRTNGSTGVRSVWGYALSGLLKVGET